ncbi:MAG: TA system VapC family ribonuclease toxin [Nocardioides sp.]
MSAPHLLDINVLLALSLRAHVHHMAARDWLAGITSIATTPITEAGFVRLMLNMSVTGRQFAPAEVIRTLTDLRLRPDHVFLPDDTTLGESRIDLTALAGHRQVTDLHLTNLAARHGAVFATFDSRLVNALRIPDRTHVVHVPS